MTQPLEVKLTPGRVRQLGMLLRKKEFNSADADAFLQLYRMQLHDRIEKAIKDFMKEKL
jgi:hypothetical protein